MSSVSRRLKVSLACLVAVGALCMSASAQGHERTQFGHSIIVGPGEEASDVTCFGCGVRIRGHVSGDVTSFGGSIVLEEGGEVAGDTTSFGGDVRLNKDTKIGGELTVFGGHIRRDPAASIGGDISDFGGPIWLFLIFVLPFIVLGAFIALIIWVIRRLTRHSVPASA